MISPRLMLLAVLALALTAAGCGEPSGTPAELRIGLIAPVSGALHEVGRSTVSAAEMAVAEINDSGGLLVSGQRHRVVLFTEDDRDQAEVAASSALKLINQHQVVAIVGPQASRNAIPAARVAEQAEVPLISPWSTHPETTRDKRWVFRVAFMDTFQGRVMARFAGERLGVRRVAVLFDAASEYNSGLAAVFRDQFEAQGGAVVAYEAYTRDVPEVAEHLKRIQAAGAEALFLPNYHNEVPGQARQARALGIKARLLGGDSWAQIPAVHRRVIEGAFFTTHYYAPENAPENLDPVARGFVERYQRRYDRVPDDVAALTYDAFGLLFRAAGQGRLDPVSIRDGLRAIEAYPGVTGAIRYAGSGDPVKSAVVLEVQDGKFLFHARVEP